MTVLLISSCYAVIVGASPAKTINYQGQLKDNTNTPITTPTTIRFSIYNNPTTGLPTDIASGSGPLLWTEIYDGSSCAEVIPNSLGIISVRLGSCTNFPAYLTFNDDYYLGLTIESNSEATPRLRLSSVPYSENVRNITFDNNTANAFRIGTTIADYLSFNTTTGSERITLGQNTTIGTPSNTLTIGAILQGATPLVFEGSTVDGNRTSIAITDPTGNRIITLPDNSGTVALLSDLPSAITASNGLSRVLNDMQLGGVLTQDTLIDGNGGAFDLTFQDLKSFDIGGGGVGALGSISNTNVDVIATNLLQLLSPLTYVQSGTPNVSGLRLVNLTSSAPTGLGQAIGVDVLGNIITVAGGSLTTANNGLTLNPAGNVQLGGVLIQNTNINLGVNTLTFDQTDVNSRFKIQGASAYSPGFASQDVFQLETFANEGFAITSYQSGPLITDDHGMFLNFTSNLANPLGDSLGAFIYSNRTTGEIGMGRFGGGQISISDNGIDLRSNGQNNFQAETSQTFFANNSSLLLPGEAGYNFTTTNAYNSDLAVANFSSGTGSGIDLFVGGFNPNGQFTGDPGSIYFNTTPSDNNDILWLKSPFGGFNTNTGWIPVAVGGPINDWSLTGNFGTDGGVTNFLGTLDAQDFVIKVDNIEKGRFYNQYNSVAFGSGQAQSGGMFVFGSSAGLNATNAQGSNFFNRLAGANATNAFNSNFMGEFSGFGATNANNSNFFGQGAGQNATNAADSIFIGSGAGNNDAVDNFNVPGTSILIGKNTNTGGFSNSIALGENAVNDRTNQFLVGPAYSDFSFRNVNYTFPSAQATGVGEVLTNDGTGILSWAVAGIGSVTASNGLNAVGIDVRLGGALTQPTTITATGGDNLTINGSNYTTNTGVLSVSRDAGSAAAGAAIQGNSIVNAGIPLVQNIGGRFDAISGDTGVATINYGTLNTASVSATAPGIVNVGSRNVANFNISGGNLASLRGAENSATLGAGSVGSAFGSLNDILLQNGTNITNAHGVATSLTKGATASVSRYSGFYMEDNNTGIANRSGLFLGTAFNAGYTGEWGIYSGLDRNNAINGSLSVGSLVAPVRKLEVTDVATTNVARFSGLGGTECSVVTGTGWSCSSDERLKDNITNIMSGTNIIVGLRPVTYNWKTEGTTQYGFVAQEVQQLVPELVIENSDGYLSLNTSGLIPYIVKSQQEQIVAIKSIEDQLTTIQLSTNTIDIQNITDGLSANMAQINTRIDEIDSKLISMQTKTDELFAGSVSLTLTDLSQLQDNIQINNLVVTYANITNLDITGNTKISGLLSISKPIQVSSDIAGKAVISAGVNHVDVTFTNPYVGTPIVTVSNVGDSALTQEFKYSITNITASGFRIQLNTHVLSNLEFNWIALDRI